MLELDRPAFFLIMFGNQHWTRLRAIQIMRSCESRSSSTRNAQPCPLSLPGTRHTKGVGEKPEI
jgi:hypothetical protein